MAASSRSAQNTFNAPTVWFPDRVGASPLDGRSQAADADTSPPSPPSPNASATPCRTVIDCTLGAHRFHAEGPCDAVAAAFQQWHQLLHDLRTVPDAVAPSRQASPTYISSPWPPVVGGANSKQGPR